MDQRCDQSSLQPTIESWFYIQPDSSDELSSICTNWFQYKRPTHSKFFSKSATMSADYKVIFALYGIDVKKTISVVWCCSKFIANISCFPTFHKVVNTRF